MLEQKRPASTVPADFGLSERTVRKWLARWRAPEQVAAIEALPRQRLTAPLIARRLGLPLSTVGGILRRLSAASSASIRQHRSCATYASAPGELIHIDTKEARQDRRHRAPHRRPPLRRGQPPPRRRCEYLHVAVDDASRLAYPEILPDERPGLHRDPPR